MMTITRFLMRAFLALSLMCFGQFVFAEDYYWLRTVSLDGVRYSSPVAACQSYFPYVTSGVTFTYHSVEKHTDVNFSCVASRSSSSLITGVRSVSRGGDGCTLPSTYNSSTGECEAPEPDPCADTAGEVEWHLSATGKTRISPTDPFPPGDVTGDPTMCSGSCRYTLQHSSSSLSCGSIKGGSPLVHYCLFKYSGAGEQCNAGDAAQNNGSTPPVPPTDPNDPTDPANNCGPTHVWSGSTCVAKLDEDDDGGGGDPSNPGNPGDGGDGGDDGDGGNGGNDGGDGGDGGNGGGSNDGDPSTVEGESCDADLKCTGDAIQCAILRQQKASSCTWRYGNDEKQAIEASLSGEGFELDEKTVDVAGLFNDGANASRWLPSSCPAPRTANVMGRTYELSFEPLCRFATALGPIIVALASIFFTIYVGRGIKGS
jgi:uncharacterized membrane protein YgcG